MTARALMILGTGSHVGKSLLAAAFCRIFKQEGFRVAPFKAQNMALNSAATPEGLEIGRAQAMQAEAAGLAPTVDMNPVLIKPSSDTSAQYVVRGKVWQNLTAADYFNRRVPELFPLVVASYRKLAAAYDIIVLEGAGSPAEINLKDRDIVNLRMAAAADAACLLIGDIDRGGVFASLYGTLALLEAHEQARIRGFLINKFRGDELLLTPGVRMFEERVNKPCAGVVHYLRDVGLEEEDGVAMEDRRTARRAWTEGDRSPARRLRIGVIALPFLANFTDFDALNAEPSVQLAYLQKPHEIAPADLLILPGTKQTIHDLRWLRDNGFAAAIQAHARRALVVGVCGGMQMLGAAIHDPHDVEGGGREEGFALLPISTTLAREKVTVPAAARLRTDRLFGQAMNCVTTAGYEIHLGQTDYLADAQPLFHLRRAGGGETGIADGALGHQGRVLGTYLHGLFDDDAFRHAFLRAARAACGLHPPASFAHHRAEREARFERWADHVRQAIKLNLILDWLQLRPDASGASP